MPGLGEVNPTGAGEGGGLKGEAESLAAVAEAAAF